jgi:formamidopyrimidine-DNA glycosylase
MPELPDISCYEARLEALFVGRAIEGLRLQSPFLVRTYEPSLTELVGRTLEGVSHWGKRLIFKFDGPIYAVVYLMVAGRFKLGAPGKTKPLFGELLAFDFATSRLILTEVSKKKRASLHVLRSWSEVQALDRGGLDPITCDFAAFCAALTRENRTLKRALTDPRVLSGIGNAYSDEILFWAELSPVARTESLTRPELERLFVAMRSTLRAWTRLLLCEVGSAFPERVTAFRPEMAAHGRYQKPCRMCSTPIQRIRYADNETNYCPRCQTDGKLLRDRSLSLLLKKDWPKTIDELEGG